MRRRTEIGELGTPDARLRPLLPDLICNELEPTPRRRYMDVPAYLPPPNPGAALCRTQTYHPNSERPAKPCDVIRGGRSRYWFFSAFRHSLSIPPGPHFKGSITGSLKTAPTIFLPFTRPKSSAIRRTRFLGQNRIGGLHGFSSLLRFSSSGLRRAFG